MNHSLQVATQSIGEEQTAIFNQDNRPNIKVIVKSIETPFFSAFIYLVSTQARKALIITYGFKSVTDLNTTFNKKTPLL